MDWYPLWNSLRIAAISCVLVFFSGIALAYYVARLPRVLKGLLDVVLTLPLVLPPVVSGFLLLLLLGRKGVLGAFLADHFGIVFSFRWTGAALASAVMGFPLMVRAIRLSIESVDRRLEAASGTLGAPPVATFFLITLPLAFPGIVVGSILSFAKALGEFGATITFVSNIPGETQTISALIYTNTQVPGGDAGAMRLMLVSTVIAFAALLVSELVQRRARRRLSLVP